MKKNSILMFAILIFTIFVFQTVSAQISLPLPKIPKVKKEKSEEPKKDTSLQSKDNSQSNSSDSEQSSNNSRVEQNQPPKQDGCENTVLKLFVDEIKEIQESLKTYTPSRNYFVDFSKHYSENYVLYAVSKKNRTEWFNDRKITDADCPSLNIEYDKLGEVAAKKLPLYVPDLKLYPFHNVAEEKLMKSQIDNLADNTIFYVGLQQANWLIQKNDYGIPEKRYKQGEIYARYHKTDHPYCWVYYVNVIQDYAGGGTYGATYGTYVGEELMGCPAGK